MNIFSLCHLVNETVLIYLGGTSLMSRFL